MLYKSKVAYYQLDDVLGEISYKVDVPGYKDEDGRIIMPCLPCFKIEYDLMINDEKVETTSTVAELLMKSMERSRFWNDLQYKLETKYSNERSFSCNIEDKLMNHAVLSRFGGVNKFVYLTRVSFNMKIYHPSTIPLNQDHLLSLLSYIHASVIMTTLEFEMPFVFNYKARKSFADNYQYIVSNSQSLTNTNKLVDRILNILHNNPQSTSHWLLELSQSNPKQYRLSQKLKKSNGVSQYSLNLFPAPQDEPSG